MDLKCIVMISMFAFRFCEASVTMFSTDALAISFGKLLG